MTRASERARLLIADIGWLGAASAVALVLGGGSDQVFRHPPLGWHYQSAVHRVLAAQPSEAPVDAAVNLVSLQEAEALLGRSDLVVLDARPRIFFELGHLPGARSLSREQFEADFRVLEPLLRKPGQTLLIYCTDADCEDGAIVARNLQARGIASINLFPGGYAEWESGGRPVEVMQ